MIDYVTRFDLKNGLHLLVWSLRRKVIHIQNQSKTTKEIMENDECCVHFFTYYMSLYWPIFRSLTWTMRTKEPHGWIPCAHEESTKRKNKVTRAHEGSTKKTRGLWHQIGWKTIALGWVHGVEHTSCMRVTRTRDT